MSKKEKKRKRRKLSKLLTSIVKVKVRVPPPPVGNAHKTKKDYDRKEEKQAIEDDINES